MGRKKKVKSDIEEVIESKVEHVVPENEVNKYDDSNKPSTFGITRLSLYKNWFRSKYKINIDNKQCYEVSYDPCNTSNMGCGYTKFVYLIANDKKEVDNYCKNRFGGNTYIECQHGSVKLRKYKKNQMTDELFIQTVKHKSWLVDYWNTLPESYYENMRTNDRGETVYKPNKFEVISI